MIFEKVRDIVAEQRGISDKSTITDAMHLKHDLKADSLDLAEILMRVEEEFEIEVSADDAKEIQTIGEIVTALEKLINN